MYTGISLGIQPLVSTAHGQDRPGLIRQYLRYALITLLVLSAASTSCCSSLPDRWP